MSFDKTVVDYSFHCTVTEAGALLEVELTDSREKETLKGSFLIAYEQNIHSSAEMFTASMLAKILDKVTDELVKAHKIIRAYEQLKHRL